MMYICLNNKSFMTLPSDGILDVSRLSRVFDKTTATYKYYWLISIINLMSTHPDRLVFLFDEIIAGMIVEAWYPIHYFKLSFGKFDSLETNIIKIQQLLDIPIDASKEVVRDTILNNIDNQLLKRYMSIFKLNVPYRFLSPWIPNATNPQVEERSRTSLNNCPYAIYGQSIMIDNIWAVYLRRNSAILLDYSFWNLSLFLQKRNPNVPNIPSKLVKPLVRSTLTRQHRFWDRYIQSVGNIRCIYTNAELSVNGYDLDHFMPWSFVVHDLMWNLLPADSSINSSKSNCIPCLERYLAPMTMMQHAVLRSNYASNPSDKLFEDYLVFRCSIPELIETSDERFLELFKNEFMPMAQTAMNMGFAPWSEAAVYE